MTLTEYFAVILKSTSSANALAGANPKLIEPVPDRVWKRLRMPTKEQSNG